MNLNFQTASTTVPIIPEMTPPDQRDGRMRGAPALSVDAADRAPATAGLTRRPSRAMWPAMIVYWRVVWRQQVRRVAPRGRAHR